MIHPSVYEPTEDSFLLLGQIKDYARGFVLEIGTGSGIIAIEAAKYAYFVIATDINNEALKHARENAAKEKITNISFIHSDLFDYFSKVNHGKISTVLKGIIASKFDLIIFNPPYLPKDKREPKESALSTTGGKKGYEILQRFLENASEYLLPDGKMLVVFSSLTKKERVDEMIMNCLFEAKQIAEQHVSFETLYCYELRKNDLLKSLESKGFSAVRKLTKGHRGLIYTAKLGNKKIAVKKEREDITAVNRIVNEVQWLKVLNKYKIGPKFIFAEDKYFVYEFVEGDFIGKFLEKSGKSMILKILKDVLMQCYRLDMLKINKEEMHNPYKHIIVSGTKAALIDFERMHHTEDPKNVTQFCQYLMSGFISKKLKEKGVKIDRMKMIALAQKYKKVMTKESFNDILKLID